MEHFSAPFFSVIIPLYNKEHFIKNTIESVLNQSFKNFEIIIINDGSTDNSLQEAQKVKDDRVHIHSQDNKGLSETRNKGISLAKGDLIALLDADDIWLPSYLEHIKDLYLQFPEALLFGTDYKEVYSNNRSLTPKKSIPETATSQSFLIDDFFAYNMYQPLICPSCLAFKKSLVTEYAVFDSSITYAEDIDFFIRYGIKYKMAYYNIPLIEKNCNVADQITRSRISDKILPNLDSYEALAPNNTSLKKFLDLYRYIFASHHRVEKAHEKVHQFLKNIDYNNLNFKQRFLLKCPYFLLILFIKFKQFLLRFNIRITSLN